MTPDHPSEGLESKGLSEALDLAPSADAATAASPAAGQTFDISEIWSRSHDGAFDDGELGKVLSVLRVAASGPWLAGGALRRSLANKPLESDFDFFFRDADQLAEFAAMLADLGLRKVRETDHHVQYKGFLTAADREVDVQCIRFRYYANAAEVIDSFDYTVCQFAFDGETLTCGRWALWDLGRQRLAIHKITYPVSTMRRLLKYTRQGFTACGGCLATILTMTAASPELLGQLDIQYVD